MLQRACFDCGLIVELGGRHGAVVRFLPPRTVTEAEIDTITTSPPRSATHMPVARTPVSR